jgi:hypothetical protein
VGRSVRQAGRQTGKKKGRMEDLFHNVPIFFKKATVIKGELEGEGGRIE